MIRQFPGPVAMTQSVCTYIYEPLIQATEPKTARAGWLLIRKSCHQIGMDGAPYGSLHSAPILP